MNRLLASAMIALGASTLACRAPATPATATVAFDRLEPAQPGGVTVRVQAGNRGLPAGTEVRVDFPHWFYGSVGVRRPPTAVEEGWGHWSLTAATPAIAPDGAWEQRLAVVRMPQSTGPLDPVVTIASVAQPPSAHVLRPGPPARMDIVAPSAWKGGVPFELRTRLLDAHGNVLAVEARDHEPMIGEGVVPFVITSNRPEGHFTATSHPVLFADDAPTVAWLDLHGHSGLSDGRGGPTEYFRRARDEALLDGAALSDHDWQLDDAEIAALLDANDAFNTSGFVTLPAVEINRNGHEIAYFLDAEKLRGVARGATGGAMTIAEELAGKTAAVPPNVLADHGPDDVLVATHTSLARGMGTGFPLNEALPGYSLFEIYSAHGNSECETCPRRVGGGELEADEQVGSLWDALDAGYSFTLIAASDSHDGRPGDTAWGAFPGGLTAVEVEGPLSRRSVADALRTGRAWATTGERTLLQARWSDDAVRVRLVSAEKATAIEVIGDRKVIASVANPQSGGWIDIPLPRTAWRYVRLVLPDGARAWAGVHRPDQASRAPAVTP